MQKNYRRHRATRQWRIVSGQFNSIVYCILKEACMFSLSLITKFIAVFMSTYVLVYCSTVLNTCTVDIVVPPPPVPPLRWDEGSVVCKPPGEQGNSHYSTGSWGSGCLGSNDSAEGTLLGNDSGDVLGASSNYRVTSDGSLPRRRSCSRGSITARERKLRDSVCWRSKNSRKKWKPLKQRKKQNVYIK